jgi:hypothetical protein
LGLRLQLVGDRARQDVEQEVLSLRLFNLERCQRSAALAGEHREQDEHDGAADRDVQGEHGAREPAGQRVPNWAEHLARDPRSEEHHEIRDVPAHSRPDLAEDEGPEWGENPPESDAAGREETAERDHGQRRREQDVDLAHPEKPPEVSRSREDDDRTEQDAEVHERIHRPAIRTRGTAPHSAATGRINTEIKTRSAFRARRSSSSWGSAPRSAKRAVTRFADARIQPKGCIAETLLMKPSAPVAAGSHTCQERVVVGQ